MENAEELTYKGKLIEIKCDDEPQNPRNWDNLGTMYCIYRGYELGDKHELDVDEVKSYVARQDVISLPLYVYEHGGITMSVSCEGQFSDRWDSSMVGFITIELSKIREEFNVKRISKQLKNRIINTLVNEIGIYDNYLSGSAYGYIVNDEESCWGYYSIEEAMEKAKAIVDWQVKDELKKHLQRLKSQIKHKAPLSSRVKYVEGVTS